MPRHTPQARKRAATNKKNVFKLPKKKSSPKKRKK